MMIPFCIIAFEQTDHLVHWFVPSQAVAVLLQSAVRR